MLALEKNLKRLEKEKKATEDSVVQAKKEGQKQKQENTALKNLLETKERELGRLKKSA
jgi:ribosome recycling factor